MWIVPFAALAVFASGFPQHVRAEWVDEPFQEPEYERAWVVRPGPQGIQLPQGPGRLLVADLERTELPLAAGLVRAVVRGRARNVLVPDLSWKKIVDLGQVRRLQRGELSPGTSLLLATNPRGELTWARLAVAGPGAVLVQRWGHVVLVGVGLGGAPVPGAEVEVLSLAGRVLSQARTDHRGVAILDAPGRGRRLVVAQVGARPYLAFVGSAERPSSCRVAELSADHAVLVSGGHVTLLGRVVGFHGTYLDLSLAGPGRSEISLGRLSVSRGGLFAGKAQVPESVLPGRAILRFSGPGCMALGPPVMVAESDRERLDLHIQVLPGRVRLHLHLENPWRGDPSGLPVRLEWGFRKSCAAGRDLAGGAAQMPLGPDGRAGLDLDLVSAGCLWVRAGLVHRGRAVRSVSFRSLDDGRIRPSLQSSWVAILDAGLAGRAEAVLAGEPGSDRWDVGPCFDWPLSGCLLPRPPRRSEFVGIWTARGLAAVTRPQEGPVGAVSVSARPGRIAVSPGDGQARLLLVSARCGAGLTAALGSPPMELSVPGPCAADVAVSWTGHLLVERLAVPGGNRGFRVLRMPGTQGLCLEGSEAFAVLFGARVLWTRDVPRSLGTWPFARDLKALVDWDLSWAKWGRSGGRSRGDGFVLAAAGRRPRLCGLVSHGGLAALSPGARLWLAPAGTGAARAPGAGRRHLGRNVEEPPLARGVLSAGPVPKTQILGAVFLAPGDRRILRLAYSLAQLRPMGLSEAAARLLVGLAWPGRLGPHPWSLSKAISAVQRQVVLWDLAPGILPAGQPASGFTLWGPVAHRADRPWRQVVGAIFALAESRTGAAWPVAESLLRHLEAQVGVLAPLDFLAAVGWAKALAEGRRAPWIDRAAARPKDLSLPGLVFCLWAMALTEGGASEFDRLSDALEARLSRLLRHPDGRARLFGPALALLAARRFLLGLSQVRALKSYLSAALAHPGVDVDPLDVALALYALKEDHSGTVRFKCSVFHSCPTLSCRGGAAFLGAQQAAGLGRVLVLGRCPGAWAFLVQRPRRQGPLVQVGHTHKAILITLATSRPLTHPCLTISLPPGGVVRRVSSRAWVLPAFPAQFLDQRGSVLVACSRARLDPGLYGLEVLTEGRIPRRFEASATFSSWP